MKKLTAVILTLALLLAACGGMAESIFAPLAEEKAPTPALIAPSYGAMANVAEDQTEKNAEGGNIVTYLNVPVSGYNRFGAYLGERGFSVTHQETQDSQIAYALSDGTVEFVMIYDQKTHTMQLVYPQGTDHEVSLFPGYTPLEANEEIIIPGLGRFTFQPFVLDGAGRSSDYYISKGSYGTVVNSWLSFRFYNTSTSNVNFSSATQNDLFTASLTYHNADADYRFDPFSSGAFSKEHRMIATRPTGISRSFFWYKDCAPLTEADYAVSFLLPLGLRQSTDGTIAVKLDFLTGEKYVLIVRENGADRNIAAPAAAQ